MGTRPLALADHVCLALITEQTTHGWEIVRLLRQDGELGRIWSLSRPLTYRSIDRLADHDLIRRTDQGRRTQLRTTATGERVNRAWLDEPVGHLREIRTEFLLKLKLRERCGMRADPLVAAQREQLGPAIAALTREPPGDPVELWRQESALAAERFLDRIGERVRSTT